MTVESDTEFLDRLEEVDPLYPGWRPGDSVRLDMPDFARLFALARSGAAAQWRPIEEAPKDGTPFLGYLPKLKPHPVGIWWHVERSITTGKPCWYLYGLGEIYGDFALKLAPTHWMPIPPPPEGESK